MMMSFICFCRNKNQPKDIYPKGTSYHTAGAGPAAGRVARRSGPAPALAPFPVQGRSSRWPASCCGGGCLVLLLRGCDACREVGGGVQSGAALIGVRLDVGSLPPRSSSLTVTGCRLGGFPVRRDWWGGERVVGGVLPRISVGTWGLCARLCLVLVCGGPGGGLRRSAEPRESGPNQRRAERCLQTSVPSSRSEQSRAWSMSVCVYACGICPRCGHLVPGRAKSAECGMVPACIFADTVDVFIQPRCPLPSSLPSLLCVPANPNVLAQGGRHCPQQRDRHVRQLRSRG